MSTEKMACIVPHRALREDGWKALALIGGYFDQRWPEGWRVDVLERREVGWYLVAKAAVR